MIFLVVGYDGIELLTLQCNFFRLCRNRNNTPKGQKFEPVPNSATDTPDGKNGIKKSGPFGTTGFLRALPLT